MEVSVSVLTPTLPGRESLLEECRASVSRLGVEHLIGVDSMTEGPGPVRNRLAAGSQAEWLLPVDDDDLVDADILDVLSPYCAGADVVYGWCRTEGLLDGQPWTPNRLFNRHVIAFFRNTVPVTALIRRSVFDTVGGFRGVPVEDYDLWRRLLGVGARFRCVPEVVWTYRMGEWARRNKGEL